MQDIFNRRLEIVYPALTPREDADINYDVDINYLNLVESSNVGLYHVFNIYLESSKPDTFANYTLFNASSSSSTITSIEYNTPNISVSGLYVGQSLSAYSNNLFSIVVSAGWSRPDGSSITIEFLNGVTAVINVIAGSRFLFIPRSEMVEFVSFMTDVITSRNGTEQRRSLRKYPRISISTSWIEHEIEKQNKVKNQTTSNGGHILGNGFWHMAQRIDTPTTGTNIIYVDTTTSTYEAGSYVVLWDIESDDHEILRIDSVADTQITTLSNIENTYAKAMVAPYFFMINATPMVWHEHQNHTEFEFEGITTVPLDVSAYTFNTLYGGVGVFPYQCNIYEKSSIPIEIENNYYEFDSYTGSLSKVGLWDSSKRTIQVGIHAKTRAECWELRQLLYYLRGRQKTVWIPTFNTDFVATADLSGTSITCSNNGYSQYIFSADTIFNHIGIYESGESPVYAEITNAVESGDSQTLTISESVSAIKEDVNLCLLVLSRLNSDTIEIEWVSPSECYCILEFISVKE